MKFIINVTISVGDIECWLSRNYIPQILKKKKFARLDVRVIITPLWLNYQNNSDKTLKSKKNSLGDKKMVS